MQTATEALKIQDNASATTWGNCASVWENCKKIKKHFGKLVS
jgi:hypothetical protein